MQYSRTAIERAAFGDQEPLITTLSGVFFKFGIIVLAGTLLVLYLKSMIESNSVDEDAVTVSPDTAKRITFGAVVKHAFTGIVIVTLGMAIIFPTFSIVSDMTGERPALHRYVQENIERHYDVSVHQPSARQLYPMVTVNGRDIQVTPEFDFEGDRHGQTFKYYAKYDIMVPYHDGVLDENAMRKYAKDDFDVEAFLESVEQDSTALQH